MLNDHVTLADGDVSEAVRADKPVDVVPDASQPADDGSQGVTAVFTLAVGGVVGGAAPVEVA